MCRIFFPFVVICVDQILPYEPPAYPRSSRELPGRCKLDAFRPANHLSALMISFEANRSSDLDEGFLGTV